MAAKSETPPTKRITLGLVLSWIFGVIFALAGLGGTIEGSFGFGIPLLLAGLVLLPPVRSFIREKAHFELSAGLLVTIIVILLVISIVNTPTYERAPVASATDVAPTAEIPARPPTAQPTAKVRRADITVDRVQVQAANLYPIRVTVRNTGDVAITPKFDVLVTDTTGVEVCSGSPIFDEFSTITPGQTKTGEFSIMTCIFNEDGTYTVAVDLLDSDYAKLDSGSKDVVVGYWSTFS